METRVKGRLTTEPAASPATSHITSPVTSSIATTKRPGRGGRPFSQATNLGKIMAHRDINVMMVQSEAQARFGPRNGINNRSMSDYLSGRRELGSVHRSHLAEILGVDPGLL